MSLRGEPFSPEQKENMIYATLVALVITIILCGVGFILYSNNENTSLKIQRRDEASIEMRKDCAAAGGILLQDMCVKVISR